MDLHSHRLKRPEFSGIEVSEETLQSLQKLETLSKGKENILTPDFNDTLQPHYIRKTRLNPSFPLDAFHLSLMHRAHQIVNNTQGIRWKSILKYTYSTLAVRNSIKQAQNYHISQAEALRRKLGILRRLELLRMRMLRESME